MTTLTQDKQYNSFSALEAFIRELHPELSIEVTETGQWWWVKLPGAMNMRGERTIYAGLAKDFCLDKCY